MKEIWGVPRLATCAILLSLASRCADHWWQRSSSSPWKPVNWQKAQVPLRLTESSPCPKTGFSPMPSDAPADADASVTGRKRLEPRAKFHGQRVTGDDGPPISEASLCPPAVTIKRLPAAKHPTSHNFPLAPAPVSFSAINCRRRCICWSVLPMRGCCPSDTWMRGLVLGISLILRAVPPTARRSSWS